MEIDKFIEIKKEFLKDQLNGKKYYEEGSLFIPKSYADEKGWTGGSCIVLCAGNNKAEDNISKLNPFSDEEKDKDLAIKIAICRAYEDSQARLITGHKEIVEDLYNFGKKDSEDYISPLGYLLSEIKEFLKPVKQFKYDKWHSDVCDKFKAKYNKLLNSNKKCEEQKIGKIQKIVNMTMKYLYCMTNDNEVCFKECHMPLDHYTLENWFCRVIKDKKSPSKDKIGKWSKIAEYGEMENEEYTVGSYMWIQSKIRGGDEKKKYCFDDGNSMTPLQAEFIIWEEEKIREALLGVINLEVNEKNQYYADLQEIKNKASEVVKKLNDEE